MADGLAAVETASAVTGYGWADGCESLKERQRAAKFADLYVRWAQQGAPLP